MFWNLRWLEKVKHAHAWRELVPVPILLATGLTAVRSDVLPKQQGISRWVDRSVQQKTRYIII